MTGNVYARCTYCALDFSISNGGLSNVKTHLHGKHHQEMATACSSRSVKLFFPATGTSRCNIEAEALWTRFVTKHNISFQTSDHATKLFSHMFPDSNIAKKLPVDIKNTVAIVKEALTPHFLSNILNDMSKFFSIMIYELNDKTDKSCIILVRVFDSCVGDIRTRFLDMPIVNLGTAHNLFDALK